MGPVADDDEAEEGGEGLMTLDLALPRLEGPDDGLASLLVPPELPDLDPRAMKSPGN